MVDFPDIDRPSDEEAEGEEDIGHPQGLSDVDESTEDSHLPSQAVNTQRSTSALDPKQSEMELQAQDLEDEDDADLEAEMREGLADADDDTPGAEVAPQPDSESESEAE